MTETSYLADRVRVLKGHGAVPGLLFRLTADRLRTHCLDRATYHDKRGQEKAAEIPAMEAAVKSLAESVDKIKGFSRDAGVPVASGKSMANSGYGFQGTDQVSDLEQQIDRLRTDIKDHRNKAATFLFLAESVFDNDYALEWADLVRLELAK